MSNTIKLAVQDFLIQVTESAEPGRSIHEMQVLVDGSSEAMLIRVENKKQCYIDGKPLAQDVNPCLITYNGFVIIDSVIELYNDICKTRQKRNMYLGIQK